MLSLVRLHVCSQPYRAALAQGALVQLARCATATSVVPEALPSNLKLADSGLFEPAPEAAEQAAKKPDLRAAELRVQVLSLADPSKVVDTITLDRRVFGAAVRGDIVHKCINYEIRKLHTGMKKTKRLAEISGSGKKLYKQKGTGKARAGQRRSSIRVGGAKAHGPVLRSKLISLNRKEHAFGLRSVLADKYQDGFLTVVDDAVVPETDVKTRVVVQVADAHGWHNATIVDAELNEAFQRAVSNLKHIHYVEHKDISCYELLKRPQLVLTRDALQVLQDRLRP